MAARKRGITKGYGRSTAGGAAGTPVPAPLITSNRQPVNEGMVPKAKKRKSKTR